MAERPRVARLLLAWPATAGDPAVDALRGLLPHADELPGCPEPPRPDFPAHLDRFLTTVTAFAAADRSH